MATKKGRTKNKCKVAWKEWEAGYAEKKGGKEEAAREKREFYCDNGKIKLRPSTDGDVPLTDRQIKKGASMKKPKKKKEQVEMVNDFTYMPGGGMMDQLKEEMRNSTTETKLKNKKKKVKGKKVVSNRAVAKKM